MRVASALARAFGQRLASAVDSAGGRAAGAEIEAEDVSKEIVDTEARLRQRSLLAERLTEILRTRKGSVAELVEAERAVAAAQEEIDQARGWLAALRARVAMSTIEISYDAIAAATSAAPGTLADAVATSWSGFVFGVVALLRALILLLPWALLVAVGLLVWRRWQRRSGVEARIDAD